NTVMATPRTAPLYGCQVASGWQRCTLSPPRSGYFTTLGFLNANVGSFLSGLNNVRRVVAMAQTIVGEGLARTGMAGAAAGPSPDCIDKTDMRVSFSQQDY